jgi:hypothetical protein
MKECYIIGYKPCQNKETKENLLRIIIEIKSQDEKLIGNNAIICFLNDTEELRNFLNEAIENNTKVYYETTDNIETGKTKITKFHF